MIFQTIGIVLRAVKYGESSLVVNIFTELFGIQSYIVNGARTAGKNSKAHFFQPSSILDLQVYHNELKNLQRIKEVKWNYLYKHVLSDVTKNSIALFIVELLQKCLKQPENNTDLFHFAEDSLMALDSASEAVAANFAIYFSLQLAQFFGFTVTNSYSAQRSVFDIQEGIFIEQLPHHPHYLQGDQSFTISQLMKVMHPDELDQVKIGRIMRRELLFALQSFYGLHMQDFGIMKSLPILQEILS